MVTLFRCTVFGVELYKILLFNWFQFTSSQHSLPYVETRAKERLHKLYLYLQGKLHSTSRPLKLVYYSGPKENVIAWVSCMAEIHHLYRQFSLLAAEF